MSLGRKRTTMFGQPRGDAYTHTQSHPIKLFTLSAKEVQSLTYTARYSLSDGCFHKHSPWPNMPFVRLRRLSLLDFMTGQNPESLLKTKANIPSCCVGKFSGSHAWVCFCFTYRYFPIFCLTRSKIKPTTNKCV